MGVTASQTSDPTTGRPPRRRRRILVSLKIFMAFLVSLVVADVIGYVLHYQRQEGIIREVLGAGGNLTGGDNIAPRWLQKWLGPDSVVFNEVHGITLYKTRADDANLARLSATGGLAQITWICLDETAVTDEGIFLLSGMTRLEVLKICGTKVTDAGLAHLKGLTSLRMLDLRNCEVTDAGVAELQQALPKLTIDTGRSPIVNPPAPTPDAPSESN